MLCCNRCITYNSYKYIQIHTNTTTTKNNLQLCNTSGANLIPWTFLSRYCHIVKHYDYCWNFLQSFNANTKVLVHQHAFSYNVTKTNNFYIFLADVLVIEGSYEMISTNIIASHFSYQSNYTVSAENNQTNARCIIYFASENAGKGLFQTSALQCLTCVIIPLPCCVSHISLSIISH